jgi:hypothetical protein
MEASAESDTERNWLQFTLNNFADPLISFQKPSGSWSKAGARVQGSRGAEQPAGRRPVLARCRDRARRIRARGAAAAGPTNDFDRMVPGRRPAPKGESAAEVLKRMYPRRRT